MQGDGIIIHFIVIPSTKFPSVVDPKFNRGGVATILFFKKLRTLHENERNWTERGASLSPHGSTTDHSSQYVIFVNYN